MARVVYITSGSTSSMRTCSRRCGWKDTRRWPQRSPRPARTAQPQRACWKRSIGISRHPMSPITLIGSVEHISSCTVKQIWVPAGTTAPAHCASHGEHHDPMQAACGIVVLCRAARRCEHIAAYLQAAGGEGVGRRGHSRLRQRPRHSAVRSHSCYACLSILVLFTPAIQQAS